MFYFKNQYFSPFSNNRNSTTCISTWRAACSILRWVYNNMLADLLAELKQSLVTITLIDIVPMVYQHLIFWNLWNVVGKWPRDIDYIHSLHPPPQGQLTCLSTRVIGWCKLRCTHFCVEIQVNTKTEVTQQTQFFCITFVQCWINVEDVGPALYNFLCLLGIRISRPGPSRHAASNAVAERQVISVEFQVSATEIQIVFDEIQIKFNLFFNKSNMHFNRANSTTLTWISTGLTCIATTIPINCISQRVTCNCGDPKKPPYYCEVVVSTTKSRHYSSLMIR